MNKERLIETLAAYSHEAWSEWMRYTLGRCMAGEEPHTQVIPGDYVQRWIRQLQTPYDQLPENEKKSDREQAEKIIAILEADAEQTRAEIAAQLAKATQLANDTRWEKEYQKPWTNWRDNPRNEIDNLWFIDPHKHVTCRRCKWEGELRDTKLQEVNSSQSEWTMLAGREGYHFNCPKCGDMADNYYTKVS